MNGKRMYGLLFVMVFALLALGGSAAWAAGGAGASSKALVAGQGTTRYVSARVPVQGQGVELGADRPSVPVGSRDHAPGAAVPYTNPWQLMATIPGAVLIDVSFPTDQVGYIAAELGQVYKTTDGGATWQRIVNIGFPYYWYGVHALDANNVAISGFINNNWSGVARWSSDGGISWTPNITLTTQGWSYRIRFADTQHGLVVDGINVGGHPNSAHYTLTGGHTAGDWTEVYPDPSPNGGWFGNQFSLLPNYTARVAGITYCVSPDTGATWGCRPSIDSVFDGPVFFANDNQAGWVGGGSISPTVEGWVHRSTDGGTTWSGRTLDGPWPIREIRFLTDQVGWAVGGNVQSGVGGMYFSTDGGQNWTLDHNTGAEMSSCDSVNTDYGPDVWCVGSSGSGGFTGYVYKLHYGGTPPTVTPTLVPTNTSTPIPTATATTGATSTPTATETPCGITFSDVQPSDYFYQAVNYLACHGAISGYADGTFRPYNNTTRSQLTKIVVLAEGWPIATPTGTPTFSDVPRDNPFFDYVETAVSHGIISGYADGTFRPYNNVTRAQLSKIIVLAEGWTLLNPPTPTFTDVPADNPFYTYVETAYGHGIISGYSDGTFRPGNNATRGQISKIVYLAVVSP